MKNVTFSLFNAATDDDDDDDFERNSFCSAYADHVEKSDTREINRKDGNAKEKEDDEEEENRFDTRITLMKEENEPCRGTKRGSSSHR